MNDNRMSSQEYYFSSSLSEAQWDRGGGLFSSPVFWVLTVALASIASLAALVTRYETLAILPALGLVFVMVITRRQTFGYLIIIFLIPFYSYRTLPPPLDNIQLHWIIAATLLAPLALQELTTRGVLRRLRSNLWPWLLTFIFVAGMSFLFSPFKRTAAEELFRQILAVGLIGLTIIYVSDRKVFETTLPRVVIWSVTLSSLLAVVGYFGLFDLFAVGGTTGSLRRGVGGTIGANSQAFMICFAFPMIVYRILYTREGRIRALLFAAMVINVLALITTMSRGGSLVLGVIILAIFIEQRNRLRPKHLGLVIATITIAAASFLLLTPREYWQRQQKLLDAEGDKSVSRRASYLMVAKENFLKRPIRGWGVNTFRELYARSDYALTMVEDDEPTAKRYAHNTYVEILVGTGVLGFAIFLGILLRAWRNFSQAKTILKEKGLYRLAALTASYQMTFAAVLVYFCIKSLMDNKCYLLALGLSQAAIALAERDWTNAEIEDSENAFYGASRALATPASHLERRQGNA